jgi:protein-disulfide isomerase
MKRYAPFLIVTLVGLITLASGMRLYRAKRGAAPPLKDASTVKEVGEALHVRGNPKAAVTIEEFGDFECPPCGKLSGVIRAFEQEYGSKLKMVFRNFPLEVHRHARDAALAAEAAGLQNKFWEMHDLLYREQAVWSKAPDARALFNAYAGTLGLDLERFKADLGSQTVNDQLAADRKHGTALGVTSTPTIFINDRAVPPDSLEPTRLHGVVEAAVNSASPK